jgi:hypothetical protein
MIHEAIHAMYFRPNGDQEIELFTIKSWFNATPPPTPTNTNMIHHNGMATYHLDKAVNILRRFDKQGLGWNANNPNITDEHYKALFLVSLLYGPDPITGGFSKLEIKKWDALPESIRYNYRKKLAPQLLATYKP